MTRCRAFELDAKWIAVYVDVGNPLSDEEESRLTSHLNLAAELGAEVITTADSDVAAALLSLGKIQNITQLIIGRSERKSKWKFFRKSLAERLLEDENRTIDLSILRQEDAPNTAGRVLPSFSISWILPEYAASIGAILAISAIGFILTPLIGYKSVGFIFLLGILQLSFYLKVGPVLLAALLSTLAWDFFLSHRSLTLPPQTPKMCRFIFIYFSTSAIIGVVNSAMRRQDEAMKIRRGICSSSMN